MSEIKKRGKSSKSKKSEEISTEDIPNSPSKKDKNCKESKDKKNEVVSGDPPPKFGPMPKVSQHRIWSRTALILGLMTVVWYNSGKKNEAPFAKFDEDLRYRGMKTKCSAGFDSAVSKFTGCVPNHCGRIVSDEVVTPQEVYALNDLVTRGFKLAKQESAAAVLDFTSGTLTFNDQSLDLYKLNKTSKIFEHGDLLVFQSIKDKLMRMVSSYFGVDYWSIFLTGPAYVSRLTPKRTKGKADEYWHVTIHKDLYGSFDYSTVLFLSDFGKDFEDGRLIFVDGDNTNRTVEAKKGRAIAFTSGEESKHYNERVSRGTRFSLTLGFTCDPSKAKKDPKL